MNHPEMVITQAEDSRYNMDHSTLGFYLAKNWDLPDHLQKIILNHHDELELLDKGSIDDDSSHGLLTVLKIAEHIDKVHAGFTVDYEWISIEPAVLGYPGLSELDFEEILSDMLEKLSMTH